MKTNKLILLFALVALAVVATSCVTSKKVRYLQDMPIQGMPLNEALEATVAPYDELRIYVLSNTGKDDELIRPFNVYNNPGQGNYQGYLVDANGNIQFPVLGELHVQGLTNPLVSARFLNFKVFFLSSSGGRVLNIADERCTFLQALAMSGGLDWYTRRDRIGVMREVDGKRVVHYLDPRSTSVFEDDFFVLQQNDIIFTEEMSYKFFSANLNTVLALISSAISLVSVYTLIRSFIKKD